MNIRRSTTFAYVLAIVALIAGLSACDELVSILSNGKTSQMDGLSGEISIGVVVAQTGEYAAPYGLPMQKGFELALERINNSGRLGNAKLSLIIEDDQSVSAVEAVDKLINQDGVSVMTGFALSTQLEQVIPTAQENEVVLFSSVSSRPGLSALGNFIFRAGLTSAVLNPPLVKATHEKFSYQKAATIYEEGDIYAEASEEEFRKALTDRSVEILEPETYQKNEADFSEQLTRIMASNPEALFISALGSDIPKIMIKARELMPSVHIIVPELTNIEVKEAEKAAEGVTTGVTTAISWRITDAPMNQEFVQKYTETYKEEPVAWAAQSYATLHILAAAIAEARSTDAMAIRDALAKTMDFDTVLGAFSFDPNGEAVYAPHLLIVENGEFVTFE